MSRVRKTIGLAALAAMVLAANVSTSAVASPASAMLAPGAVATEASALIADLKAQGDSALPIVEVQYRRHGHRRSNGRRGAAVAGGIALGVAAAIAMSQSANAAPRRDGYAYSCRRLARHCDYGERWACRRYNREC
jgi:hypothetical protein